jgi:hypothetical protein
MPSQRTLQPGSQKYAKGAITRWHVTPRVLRSSRRASRPAKPQLAHVRQDKIALAASGLLDAFKRILGPCVGRQNGAHAQEPYSRFSNQVTRHFSMSYG